MSDLPNSGQILALTTLMTAGISVICLLLNAIHITLKRIADKLAPHREAGEL